MKKSFLFVASILLAAPSFEQTISKRLQDAYERFEGDSQLSNAISSLYVIHAKTGAVIFDRNSKIGLAPASTQKIITAATAYELLGKDFRYETKFGYTGKIVNKSLPGNFYLKSSGDPTLGSWRWKQVTDTAVFNKIITAVKRLDISGFNDLTIDNTGWDSEAIPDGWIWQDIGNYYGAGAGGFNWRENQFDVVLKSGNRIGDQVSIVEKKPDVSLITLRSAVKSAAKGTGDNAYVYYPLYDLTGVVRGTIPVHENAFSISAANPVPDQTFASLLMQQLTSRLKMEQIHYEDPVSDTTILFSHYSPSLDSLIYWFLKRSINLYGEALVKTFAFRKNGFGETKNGIEIIKDFWKRHGISPNEINMADGSGLSPLNRVTTHAQVMVLKYARSQPWFEGYYNAFPEFNGMKMKSGTISDVKGFCGYHKSKEGNEYIFSFLVNNYNGSSSSVVQKMYTVLNELK